MYLICFGVGLGWCFGMDAKNNRIWYDKDKYDVNWETCQYNLQELETFELIISDWGLDKIVHTMASFGFNDGEKLSFSIEIRKESHEGFSAIGDFFASLSLGLSWAMRRI